MVNRAQRQLKVGDRVSVPWGSGHVEGRVIDVWGNPPAHVRVALFIEADEEPEYLLLNPALVSRVAA